MSKLSPQARAALEAFAAGRTPSSSRRARNYEATLARLDEEPFFGEVNSQVPWWHRRWLWALAAMLVLALLGPWLASRELVEAFAPRPNQAVTRSEAVGEREVGVRHRSRASDHRTNSDIGSVGTTPTTPASQAIPAPIAPASRAAKAPTPRSRVVAMPAIPIEDPLDALQRETRLFAQIRKSIAAHDDRDAIRLLHQHAQEFPRGTMMEDRQALLAMALCRTEAARATRAALIFVRSYPDSPYGSRVRQVCAAQMDEHFE